MYLVTICCYILLFVSTQIMNGISYYNIYLWHVLNWTFSLQIKISLAYFMKILCINTESKSILMHAHHIYLAFFFLSFLRSFCYRHLVYSIRAYPYSFILSHTIYHFYPLLWALSFLSVCLCAARAIMILIYPRLPFYLWASIRNSISGNRNSFNNSLLPHTIYRSISIYLLKV